VSEENVEVMRRSNAAFNRGDVEEALSHFHPDVHWRDLNHPPDSSECLEGTAALREVWTQWDVSGSLSAEVTEYVDAGDAVVCVTRWRIHGAGSGVDVETTWADVYELEDGLVVRATVGYASREDALKALGLEA
jgi:ketosteroid isomerase-like protein